jgi:hypothetical protein
VRISYLSEHLSYVKESHLLAIPVKLIFCGLSPFYKIGGISKNMPHICTELLLISKAMYWRPVPRWFVCVIGYLLSPASCLSQFYPLLHNHDVHCFRTHNLCSDTSQFVNVSTNHDFRKRKSNLCVHVRLNFLTTVRDPVGAGPRDQDRMSRTTGLHPASSLKNPIFKSQPAELRSWLTIFVVKFILFRQMTQWDFFLPNTLRLIIQ